MFSCREFGVATGAGKHAVNGSMELLGIYIGVQLLTVLKYFNNTGFCMAFQASLVFFGIADLICCGDCRPDQAQKKDQRPDISSHCFHDVLLEKQDIPPLYEECFMSPRGGDMVPDRGPASHFGRRMPWQSRNASLSGDLNNPDAPAAPACG